MPNDSLSNDPQSIWKNQLTEPFKMTSSMIHRKTQRLHTKTRRELLNSIGVSSSVVGLSIFGIVRFHGAVMCALFVLTIGWTLVTQYFVYRGSVVNSELSHVSLNTSLQSYRREVERQLRLSSRFLLWSFGPIMLGFGVIGALLLAIVGPHGFLRYTAPYLTLLGVLFLGVVFTRIQQQRDLQREIDELKEIERSNN
jgi:fatty acid desaturase